MLELGNVGREEATNGTKRRQSVSNLMKIFGRLVREVISYRISVVYIFAKPQADTHTTPLIHLRIHKHIKLITTTTDSYVITLRPTLPIYIDRCRTVRCTPKASADILTTGLHVCTYIHIYL